LNELGQNILYSTIRCYNLIYNKIKTFIILIDDKTIVHKTVLLFLLDLCEKLGNEECKIIVPSTNNDVMRLLPFIGFEKTREKLLSDCNSYILSLKDNETDNETD